MSGPAKLVAVTGMGVFLATSRRTFPPSTPTCELQQQTHEGYEWLYVLSGRVRIILGEHDVILTAGEVVEFDTHVPHWFGNTGSEPAEILSVFGPQGERLHVRTRPPRE